MRTIRFATAAAMLAGGLLLAAGGTVAAQPSGIGGNTDITADRPALVQDAAETIPFGDSVKDIQVGLVNVQDIANANQAGVNISNQNAITAEAGTQ